MAQANGKVSTLEAERRIVVAALVARREHGVASREYVVKRSGLSRVDGWAALANLERTGSVWLDEGGVAVGFLGRITAGL